MTAMHLITWQRNKLTFRRMDVENSDFLYCLDTDLIEPKHVHGLASDDMMMWCLRSSKKVSSVLKVSSGQVRITIRIWGVTQPAADDSDVTAQSVPITKASHLLSSTNRKWNRKQHQKVDGMFHFKTEMSSCAGIWIWSRNQKTLIIYYFVCH